MNRPGRRRRDDAARPSRGDRKRASTTAWADPRKAATCQKTKTSNVAGRAVGRRAGIFVFVWLCRGERRPDVAGVGRALRATRAHAVGCDGRVARRRQARGGRARGPGRGTRRLLAARHVRTNADRQTHGRHGGFQRPASESASRSPEPTLTARCLPTPHHLCSSLRGTPGTRSSSRTRSGSRPWRRARGNARG